MRRINMILVIGMLVTFLIHGIMGALQIAGADANAMKTTAWICVGFVALHVIVTSILTVQTLHARRLSGAGYFKDNLLFWTRRISGFLVIIPLIMHLVIFHSSNAEAYRLQVFTTGRMISQILLVAAIALHVLTNIKPALISFGVKGHREFAVDLLFILTIILLLITAAFVIYYLRWMAV